MKQANFLRIYFHQLINEQDKKNRKGNNICVNNIKSAYRLRQNQEWEKHDCRICQEDELVQIQGITFFRVIKQVNVYAVNQQFQKIQDGKRKENDAIKSYVRQFFNKRIIEMVQTEQDAIRKGHQVEQLGKNGDAFVQYLAFPHQLCVEALRV